jgi:hypothetical protein
VQRQCHDLGAVEHVVDTHPFVGLVREVEDAGPVGDAVLQPSDPVDMLLVIGAGGDDELRLPVQDPFDGA